MRVNEKSHGRRLTIFPPWLVTKDIRRQVNEVLPPHYYRRLRIYFEKYGCIRCAAKSVSYSGSGLCRGCMGLVSDRLERIDAKLNVEHRPDSLASTKAFLRRRETARRLLADFRT